MIKAFKVRLEPNNKQAYMLFQCAGTARWAYNWCLERQQENYKNGGKFIPDGVLRKKLTKLKSNEEYNWLKYFPSSKMCSCCGNIKKDLKLSDRIYSCECGNIMDRDLNASINLSRYKLA